MKKLIIICLVIISTCSLDFEMIREMQDIFFAKINEMKQKAEQKQQPLQQKTLLKELNKNDDYDLCLLQLEKTIDTGVELARYVLTKDIIDIIPKSLKLTTDIVDTIDCFMHPPAQLQDSRTECIISELKKFLLVMKQMLRDMWEKKFDKASVDLQKALEILQQIKYVC